VIEVEKAGCKEQEKASGSVYVQAST